MKAILISAIMLILLIGCQKSSDDFYTEGLQKIETEKYSEALKLFTKAIEQDSTNIRAYLERGKYGSHDKKMNPKDDLTKYIAYTLSELSNAIIGRGMINRVNGEFDDAISDFELASKLAPDNPQPYGLKIDALKAKRDTLAASEFYNNLPENIKNKIDNSLK